MCWAIFLLEFFFLVFCVALSAAVALLGRKRFKDCCCRRRRFFLPPSSSALVGRARNYSDRTETRREKTALRSFRLESDGQAASGRMYDRANEQPINAPVRLVSISSSLLVPFGALSIESEFRTPCTPNVNVHAERPSDRRADGTDGVTFATAASGETLSYL